MFIVPWWYMYSREIQMNYFTFYKSIPYFRKSNLAGIIIVIKADFNIKDSCNMDE